MLFQQLAQFVVVFFADHDAVVFGHNDEGADFGIAKNQGGQGFVLRIQLEEDVMALDRKQGIAALADCLEEIFPNLGRIFVHIVLEELYFLVHVFFRGAIPEEGFSAHDELPAADGGCRVHQERLVGIVPGDGLDN